MGEILPTDEASKGRGLLRYGFPAARAGVYFRYLLDDVRWENDWQADAYTPNPIGIEVSVVMVQVALGL